MKDKGFWIFMGGLLILAIIFISIPVVSAVKKNNVSKCIEEEVANYEKENNACVVNMGNIQAMCNAKYN